MVAGRARVAPIKDKISPSNTLRGTSHVFSRQGDLRPVVPSTFDFGSSILDLNTADSFSSGRRAERVRAIRRVKHEMSPKIRSIRNRGLLPSQTPYLEELG
jgi:hypothetical protein